MTEEDKYYFFIHSAICEANHNPEYVYCVDAPDNKLFRVGVNDIGILRHKSFKELPKLDYKIKKDFLISFAKKQNSRYQEGLFNLIENFTTSSKFNLEKDLRILNIDMAREFYFASAKFINGHVEKLYDKFQLNSGMEIILYPPPASASEK